MQRRAYASGLAALLAALSATALAGCSSGSGTDGSGIDAKTGTAAGPIAQPGRYRTLFEPCGSVPRSTLRDLLPAVTALPAEQRDRVLRGTAAVTYDTDRRVGCAWKADGPDAIHHLTLDFERVVSYDPAVSDEARAQEVYATKESAAGLTPVSPPATDQGTAAPPGPAAGPAAPAEPAGPAVPAKPAGAGTPAKHAGAGAALPAAGRQAQTVSPATSGTPSPATSGTPSPATSGTPSPATSAPTGDLGSRALTDLGDAAFLDDVLAPAGPAAQQRTVSVVFRTSNVLVTVRYAAQPLRDGEVPDSEEMQEKARRLAHRLAERFDE